MKNIRIFLSENFPILVVKCSIYLNRRVFIMQRTNLMMLMPCFCVCVCFFFLLIFFIKAYFMGSHLNCTDKSMQFKWVPITYAFIRSRQKVHWL